MVQKVRLIALTQLVENLFNDEKINTKPEAIISYCARVSNPNNQANFATSGKLLHYLMEHKHWSPFEMASAVIEVETTRDIARQILRHRSFSFQEFSQRYQKVSGDSFEMREMRLQDYKNRQNSIEVDDKILETIWKDKLARVIEAAESVYTWALDNNIAKEQARCVLPEGMTKSRLYMSGNIRSWLHYIFLRIENGTQKEHREIAAMCWRELMKHYDFLVDIDKELGISQKFPLALS